MLLMVFCPVTQSVMDGGLGKGNVLGNIQHKHVMVTDVETTDILTHLPDCVQFVREALASGGRILVHCMAGISRSSTVSPVPFLHSGAARAGLHSSASFPKFVVRPSPRFQRAQVCSPLLSAFPEGIAGPHFAQQHLHLTFFGRRRLCLAAFCWLPHFRLLGSNGFIISMTPLASVT